jgi:hypothetical protein
MIDFIVIALLVGFLCGLIASLLWRGQKPKQASFAATSYAFKAAEEVVDETIKVFNEYTKKHKEDSAEQYNELKSRAIRLASVTRALRSAVNDLLINRTPEERCLPPINPTEFQTNRFLQLQAIETCVHTLNELDRKVADDRTRDIIDAWHVA